MPRTAPLAAALSTASLLSRRHLFKLLIFTTEAARCDRQHDMIRPTRRLHATRANVFFYVSTPVRITFRETCHVWLLQALATNLAIREKSVLFHERVKSYFKTTYCLVRLELVLITILVFTGNNMRKQTKG